MRMNRRMRVGAIAGMSLALAAATVAPAFAHGQGHGVTGKITQLNGTSLQVQTASGTVTEQLTTTTVVFKETKGTVADLTPGAFASVTLASGTTTVTAVHVESRNAGSSTRPVKTGQKGTKTGTAPKTKPAGTTTRIHTGMHRGGQIVGVANGQLTLRDRQGQTTYTLGQNVTVTKTVRGQLSDLAVGETVRVAARPGATTAFAVTIESA